MESYLVPAGYGEAEYVEKKSRFISRVWPIETEEEAIVRVNEIRAKHRDATHNVYAYIVRDGGLMRYSDDGEPGGTSGLPTLDVFRKGDITNSCCVVTRYFGGILLGAGGLVRAYSTSAKLGLDAAGISSMASWDSVLLGCTYPLYERVLILAQRFEAVIRNADFGVDVVIELLLRQDRTQLFEKDLAELSAGQASLDIIGTEFLGVKIS